MRLKLIAGLISIAAIVGVIYASNDLVNRQNHVATVASNASKAAKTAKKTAAKTAVKVAKTTQADINRKIILSQLNACRRGKAKNDQINYDTDLLKSFMLVAVKALRAKPDKASQERAVLYQGYADHLRDIPQVNCEKVIYHPPPVSHAPKAKKPER